MFPTLYIADTSCVTPLGFTVQENWEALLSGTSGLAYQDVGAIKQVPVGRIADALLDTHFETLGLSGTFSRLEKMMLLAASPLVKKHQPNARTAFVMATTKGNINALREGQPEQALLTALGDKLQKHLAMANRPIIVSQACVSGVLAVSVAKRMIQMGMYDNALVLTGDELSEFVVSGFQSFQAIADQPCRPFDKQREGVSLGEAAAAIYLTKEKNNIRIAGEGSINDANHISGPSRTGEGLYQSILAACQEAEIEAGSLDFIAAHGTATLYNDEMEAIAFDRLGLQDTPVHSLKGFYGHTLGAAGLLELVILVKAMQENTFIASLGFTELGVSRPITIVKENRQGNIQRALKTASGFGGSNAVMVLIKE